jgi:hypothetical protein
MFCPKCKTEYRPGFTHCPDCDVDLVSELPPDARRGDMGAQRVVWKGEDEWQCVALCRELQSAEIPYKVSQTEKYRDARMGSHWDYEIAVPPAEYEKAKNLLGIGDEPEKDEGQADQTDDAWRDSPEPARVFDTAAEANESDSSAGQSSPEEASVEICSLDAPDAASFLEICFKENQIRWRCETIHGGAHRFFVAPEDASRAREIVREVQDGTPLE